MDALVTLVFLTRHVNLLTKARSKEMEREKKEERANHHRRRKQRRLKDTASELEALRPEMAEFKGRWLQQNICGECSGEGRGGEARISWESIPSVLRPSSEEEGGIERERKGRVRRKEWQLESVEFALSNVIEKRRSCQIGRLRVVDFGSGSGNSALVLASLHPDVLFTLVDAKADCIRLVKKR